MTRTAADVPMKREVGMTPRAPYGMELVLDLHDCDPTMFTRENLTQFFIDLCILLDMQRADLHFWDYEGYPRQKEDAPFHLKGTTAVQFISTSNITIHTLDDLRRVYLNIFTCREFDPTIALEFCMEFFNAGWCGHTVLARL